mgnify:CR=1 FL=1
MSNEITQLSILQLLSGEEQYSIPMYQRNYAWEEGEITQLIQDIIDYMPDGRNYYIGTLVVFEQPDTKPTVYETIDGQQRLTTLSLLAAYLKNETDFDLSWYQDLKVHYESREKSRKTSEAIFQGKNASEVLNEKDLNTGILNGHQLIKKLLLPKLKENNVELNKFATYLLDQVQIMRVKVPHDTDLNHYFEIMNNRGEQLEKHEVLKSKMLEVLERITDKTESRKSQQCLHQVWEACANMERYVQMGFSVDLRNQLFGHQDWGSFKVGGIRALQEALYTPETELNQKSDTQTLNDIINPTNRIEAAQGQQDDSPERFNTVINFPNFLLHVLRVESGEDIPLDDKRLIESFDKYLLRKEDAVQCVQQFTFSLLRCKYLYDQYIIKREFLNNSDGWSLKRLKWNKGGETSKSGSSHYVNTFGEDEDSDSGINRKLLMLLSGFHVSTPTLVYKHWLNAALHHLFHAEEINSNTYLDQLESVAKTFVFDRFLAADGGAEYFQMIYQNRGRCQASQLTVSIERLSDHLTFDTIENNLVFNYLDYLLWLKNEDNNTTVSSYEFTFRSSVEHYYPQHPMQGYEPLAPDTLNSFGNLCLISHSKNSRLSNFMPEAKKEYYQNNTIDSIKQHLMMKDTPWDEAAIKAHGEAMIETLVESLSSNGG